MSLPCVSEFSIRGGWLLTLYEVLNPTLRMTWIQKQWEQHYIDGAEAKVKRLVCLFLYFYIIKQRVLTLNGL
jgi:hypothetical protein